MHDDSVTSPQFDARELAARAAHQQSESVRAAAVAENAAREAAGAPRRAVIYLRVSTTKQADRDEDAEGYSLPAQRDSCYRRAEQLGAEVVGEYLDRGESAKTAARPQFQAMLRRIMGDRDVDYVILDKLDRFARNRRDDANVMFELQKAGAKLVSVKENIDETPAGQLLHAIMAGISEFYSTNLATEALKGMTQKAKVGGTPGRAPIGYLNVRTRVEGREVRTVVPDPDRAGLVQWAFQAYATGEWTVSSLTDALAEKGLKALPHGQRPVSPVKRSHVHHLLNNRYYLGIVTFQGVEYDGRHEPLVSADVFSRVGELMRSRFRAGEKQRLHNHYLKGTVWCGSCGSRLCITIAKGQYPYFYCIGRQMKRTQCTQKYLSVPELEHQVTKYYSRLRLAERLQKAVYEGIRDELKTQEERAAPEIQRAKRRISDLEDERRRLARGVVNGTIPDDLAREEQARIARELQQAHVTERAASAVWSGIERTLRLALDMLARIDLTYASSDPRTRRLINQFVFEKVFVSSDEGPSIDSVTLHEPWRTLLNDQFVGLWEMRDDERSPEEGEPTLPLGSSSRTIALVPPAGLEPAHTAPEADALSAELRGRSLRVEHYQRPRRPPTTVHPSADAPRPSSPSSPSASLDHHSSSTIDSRTSSYQWPSWKTTSRRRPSCRKPART